MSDNAFTGGFSSGAKSSNKQSKNEDWVCQVGNYYVLVYAGMVEKWRKDKSIPMVDVVDSFAVFRGRKGEADHPAKGELESEFGTSNNDSVVTQILEKGELSKA